jgi:hypothetical protein
MPPRQQFNRARENRVRRAAARQGLTLNKIQRRDPAALGWNRWLLTDPEGALLISHVMRGIETGASIDQVEDFLRGAAVGFGTATDAILRLADADQIIRDVRENDSEE